MAQDSLPTNGWIGSAVKFTVALVFIGAALGGIRSCAGTSTQSRSEQPPLIATLPSATQAPTSQAAPVVASAPTAPAAVIAIPQVALNPPAQPAGGDIHGDSSAGRIGPNQPECPPLSFKPNGAYCTVTAPCSGWVFQEPNSPPGQILFQPSTEAGVYRKILYLVNGAVLELNPTDRAPDGITAIEWCPNKPVRIHYILR